MTQRPLTVAVIGGGIGGMATAVALARKDIDVHVFEQAPQIAEVGAGVFVMPNGMRALHQLGFAEQIGEYGAPVGDGSAYCRHDGTVVAPYQTTDSTGAYRQTGMHRADLLNMLVDAVPPDRIQVNHRCISVEQSPGEIRVGFEGERTRGFDAVVGADGIRSTLRSRVGVEQPAVPSGFVAYRGLLPAASVPSFPAQVSRIWMGHNKHFLLFPVRGGEQLNYVGFVPSTFHHRETWSAPGDANQLRASFEGWAPEVTEVVRAVTECYWWGLYDREPLETWTRGRMALLGDAAHPMLPHLGQGANQAIEDAVTLGEVLSGAHPTEVPDRLRMYQEIRRPRTMRVQDNSRATGSRFDSTDENLTERDRQVGESLGFKLWLYDHDARAVALDALAETAAAG